MDKDELKREKAKRLRYAKPAVRELNLEAIQEGLCEIREACSDVQWYIDSEDGSDTLLNAIEDEDDVYEFKMSFATLELETEKMYSDIEETWIPECFDLFFVGINAKSVGGGMYGWDEYEGDYFGLDSFDADAAERKSREKLERMTKRELLDAMEVCFRVAVSYIGLRTRFENLKAALDILRDQNTAVLKQVRAIDEAYNKAAECDFDSWRDGDKEFDKLLAVIPDRLWLE